MKSNRLKQYAALAGSVMISIPMMASLASANFAPHKDAKGAIYFAGAPNAEIQVAIAGLPQTRNITANACGVAVIRNSLTRPVPATFTIGANTITTANLPTQLLPRCLTTGQLEEARTQNFKTSDGSVVLVSQTPSASVQMLFDGSKIRKLKMNACGFGRISNSSTNPFGADVKFTPQNGSEVTYGNLPTQLPWLCKDGVTYQPVAAGVGGGS